MLTAKKERDQVIFHKLRLGNLDGIFLAIEETQGVVTQNNHIPMITVRNEKGLFPRVEDINCHIQEGKQDNDMVFGEPGLRIAKPGKKNKDGDKQGENNGCDQSPDPYSIGILLVIYFHFYACSAPF